jgi:hypothetical protein
LESGIKEVEAFNNNCFDQYEDKVEDIEEIRKEPDAPGDAEEKSLEPTLLYEMKKL